MSSQTRRMDSSLNTGDPIDTRKENSFYKVIGEKERMDGKSIFKEIKG